MATTPVMKMTPPWTPELLITVQKDIERHLSGRTHLNVLELGSGWSTVWLAAIRGVYVVSYEHDLEWRHEVDRAGMESKTDQSMYLNYVDSPSKMELMVSREKEKRYDLALVDCMDEARLPCLFACLTKVKDDGWIVFDDSHWERFDAIPTIMHEMGYARRRFMGDHTRKTGEVCYHQTDIYCKKGFDNV